MTVAAEHRFVVSTNPSTGETIGSVEATTAAATFKTVLLELGGKAPNVIFADADVAAAVDAAVRERVEELAREGWDSGQRLLVNNAREMTRYEATTLYASIW